MRHKSVIVIERGSPEVLQVIENDLRAPSAGEGCGANYQVWLRLAKGLEQKRSSAKVNFGQRLETKWKKVVEGDG